ncbi:MAG: VCBS repeat-containing protein, partial [Planctomycetes bacterium]|nr:VCBS repeat-containing protein [Planctomycetota bacterium]
DGDGVLDLYLTDQGGSNHLFLGRGDGTFQPAPGPLADPVTMAGSASGAATFVDYDNSGRPSLLVLTEHGPRLFRNEGGRSFADVTEAAGLVDDGKGETASWADFDGDGDLDLFVANYGCQPCSLQNRPPYDLGHAKLFRNDGDGTFEDRTDLLEGIEGVQAMSFVGVWIDADDDGDPDLLVANDTRGADLTGEPSALTPGNVLIR